MNNQDIEKIYALSPLQSGILFHALHGKASDQYCVQIEWTYEGNLDPAALKAAWQGVIDHHEILRTCFAWEGLSKPVQIVVRKVKVPWFSADFSTLDKTAQATHLQQYLTKDRFAGFDLSQPCAMRLHLIKLFDDQYHFIFTNHHIILDGWSLPLLLDDLMQRYAAIRQGIHPVISPTPPYERYIAWIHSQSKKEISQFWQQQLSTVESATDLRIQKQDIVLDSNKPIQRLGSVHYAFDRESTEQIIALAKEHQTTVSSVTQLAWATMLSRYSGEERVIYGSVLSGRSHAIFGIEKMVGLLINTVPIVIEFNANETVASHLQQMHGAVQEANHYSYCSLTEMQRYSAVPAGQPLFTTLFVFENYPTEGQTAVRDVQISDIRGHEKTNYPLTVLAYIQEGKLHIKIDYDSDCFERHAIQTLLLQISHFITQAITHAQQPISKIKILTPSEHQQILVDWNATSAEYPREKTIYQLFEEQVEKTPEQIAVVYETEHLTYQALNAKANQLARLIQEKYQQQHKKALKPDTLIGLCVERSLDMLVGILGILKAGAAYVPLDPNYPEDRLEYMIADSHEGLILTQQSIVKRANFLKKLHPKEILVLDSEEVKQALAQQRDDNVLPRSGPRDLAYVIYTSGSTGRPKGVMIEHHALNNRLHWMQQAYRLTSKDRIMQKTPFSFDVSVWELLWSICYGATLVFAKPEGHKDPAYLLELIHQQNITKIHFVPSLLHVFIDDILTQKKNLSLLSSLQDIFCSGEALPFALQQRILKHLPLALHNLYGPTEASIDVSYYNCKQLKGSKSTIVPIGKPINNIQLYILDQNFNPCPVGVPGELYIGGVGLARGYLNQPTLTEERFIRNPFVEELGLSKTDRLYKTGDLVRWLPDGNVEYLGRTDFQVKIRGFRIELGEIENVLTQHEAISQATVLAIEKAGNKYLAAYYVLAKDKTAPSMEELKAHLAKRLPDYMIPTAFVLLEKMPLTPSGKVNRKALPSPDLAALAETHVAPRTTVEKQLARIWGELLDIEKIGIHDNFFYLGGHSLLVIRLMSKINKFFNLDLSISWAFQYRTVIEQAKSIVEASKKRSVYQPILKLKEQGDNPILFLIHPGEGGAEAYQKMAQSFAHYQPVYGINSYNLEHLDNPIYDMKSLAAKYIKYIQEIQPKGPYFLGGWSLGGIIIYEIAQQLMEKGEIISGFYLLDAKALIPESWPEIIELFPDKMMIKQLKLNNIKEEAAIKKLLKIRSIETELLRRYHFTKLKGINVILMQALNSVKTSDMSLNECHENVHKLTNLPANGWNPYIENLKVYRFNADHQSIMTGKHLERVVKIIQRDIDQKKLKNNV